MPPEDPCQNLPGLRAVRCLAFSWNHAGLVPYNYYMSSWEEVLVLGWSECSSALEDVAGRLRGLAPGEKIRVVFSNQDFAIDISAWCHETGNRLIDLGSQDDKYYAVIEKA